MSGKGFLLVALATLATVARLYGTGPSFHPDASFKGSALTGWHTLGDANWSAENGEITGAPTQPGGGWLVVDHSYQDIGFYASFRCAAGCKTGLLMRAEKTPEGGMKGVFVSLNEGDLASYALTLDAQGRELKREKLRHGGGQMRIAPPLDPQAPTRPRPPVDRPGLPPGATLPVTAPDASLRAGEWNTVETFLDANIVRSFLNNGGEVAGGVAEDDIGNYGPLALYVGGTGDVQFKDVSYKDLSIMTRVPEQISDHFRMQRLSDFYYSWGASAADFNQDGVMDIVSGPHIYFGPDYTTHREIYEALTTNPSDEYARDDWMQFSGDFTGDGWPDVINCSFSGKPGVWLYVNPRGESRRWDKYLVVPAFSSEIAVVRDIDGDGKLELVYMAEGYVRYAKPDPANPTGPWIVHNVSQAGYATAHGIGVGDINGDGRLDIINAFGWWEQPPPGSQQEAWTYHREAFARYGRNIMGGSVMAVYDVNGDGLNDIVTALNVHGYGLAWFEQKRDSAGKISFVQHMIMDDLSTKNAGGVTFTEPHGTTYGDVDGDGIPDFIIGKRYWSHRDDYLDPDPYGPAVLYWYKTVRNPKAPGGAEFVPELIHNRSGAGSDIYAADLNNDGALDIVTATRFGTFIFWGKPGVFKQRGQ
ncbi:MAG: FG-GAP-like repeat-containing protein [Candidatus Acidiferrales bacterium]|jgi:hypothetical protein